MFAEAVMNFQISGSPWDQKLRGRISRSTFMFGSPFANYVIMLRDTLTCCSRQHSHTLFENHGNSELKILRIDLEHCHSSSLIGYSANVVKL